MNHDLRWNLQYERYMQFIEEHRHCPSKHKIEDRALVNWMKYNKKMMAIDKMCPERREKMKALLEKSESVRRINQYTYKSKELWLF